MYGCLFILIFILWSYCVYYVLCNSVMYISQFSVFLPSDLKGAKILKFQHHHDTWSTLEGGVSGASHTLSQLCWCIHPIAALGPALASGGCLPGLMLRKVSEKRDPGCLGYLGDYVTTQLYRDYNKPLPVFFVDQVRSQGCFLDDTNCATNVESRPSCLEGLA